MTIAEIEKINKEFLLPADIAPLLGVNPQNIRSQAQEDPTKLGFPVIVMGVRIHIPKSGFLHYCRYGRSVIAK